MDAIKTPEAKAVKKTLPSFNVGDTLEVFVRITEEGKSRLQPFSGVVIRKKGSGIRETFTVRRVSYGEGVERIFPLHSPALEKINVLKKGEVRRAKLYYLREKIGKKAKVEEKEESSPEQTPLVREEG